MGNTTDFDKLRKKRRRKQTLKRVAVVLAIALGLTGILSINYLLVDARFVAGIRDFLGSFGGPGYPIPVPGGTLREVKALESNVAVLNDTNLYIYSKRGKELLNLARMSENSIVLTGGSRVLSYEIGGTKYQIHSRTNQLLEREHDYSITTMALGARGDYAVVSSSKQYTAQVTAYDSRFEQVFQWSSNELVSNLALHPRGNRLAAGTLGASGGVIRSTILLFSFDSTQEIARVELPGELLLQLEYLDNDTVGILTDKGYHLLDGAGKLSASHSFGGARLVAARFFGGDILLLTESPESRSQALFLVNAKGTVLGTMQPDRPVKDMQAGGGWVYLLTAEGIVRCDRSLAPVDRIALSGVKRILYAGDALYCFTDSDISILDLRKGESA